MTWLYTPSNFLPASACLARECEPGSDTWTSKLAASATSSGKVMQPQFWRRVSKAAHWTRLLSGLTFAPSTLDAGAEQWIASLRDSRAKTSASPGGAQALMARDPAFSSKSCALPTIAVRGSSFWRTSQASLLPPPPLWTRPKATSTNARPPASWENWPTAGGTRSGSLFQRPMWAPATAGNGGSVSRGGTWLTPHGMSGMDSKTGRPGAAGEFAKQATNWPTPSASVANDRESPESWHARAATLKAKHMNGNGAGLPLTVAAAQWPTPAARDSKGANSEQHCTLTGGGRKHMDQLANFVAYSPLAQQIADGPTSSPLTPTSRRLLNPLFGAWLMGWPSTWVIADQRACDASAMALYRSRLQRQLSCLLGEREFSEQEYAA